MAKRQVIADEEKDLPLRDNIRLLGRILGDTVREQDGAAGIVTETARTGGGRRDSLAV